MHKYFLILCLISMTSCSTLLNGKKTKVHIYAPKNTKLTYNNTELKVTDKKVTIYPIRSKDSLTFTLSNDSISNEFSYSKRISGTIFLNTLVPFSFGAGFIVDYTNPKRFTYKRNHYFYIDSKKNAFYAPHSEPVHFKKNDLFVYTSPLKTLDIFSQPMLTIGAEYFFSDQMSFSAEYGTVFTKRLGAGNNTRLKIVENKGRAFRYEVKYYNNLLNISNNPRVNEYISFETRFLRYQFNDDITFTREIGDIRYTINETLAVQKSINIFNIKYGLNYPIGKRLYIDLYSGFGLRIRKLKNFNRNFNPDTDFLQNDDDHYNFRRANIQGLNDGQNLNFSLGFKFGYKF